MWKWKLNQTKQCATCPWRVESTIMNIPGYCSRLHQDLKDTITDDISITEQVSNNTDVLKIMLCHHNNENNHPIYCIGWVHNQLGTGNNIQLRIDFTTCENADEIEVIGEQVRSFEDTFK